MEETPTIRKIQTSKEGEVEHEQPLSPLARLFHESGTNVYNIAIFGMKTLIDVDVFKAELLTHMVEKNRRLTSLQFLNGLHNNSNVIRMIHASTLCDIQVVWKPMRDQFLNGLHNNSNVIRMIHASTLCDIQVVWKPMRDQAIKRAYRSNVSAIPNSL
ncbi:O-acyltransferase, WSD1 domain-containing protein [Artemisia annua]|uniref:O-acyltransferase, WSD1 domain-containing protein n=1 Tax=Artemisia annua TaxID=35608 RepID=A0A2U1N132_ARTAN|nr:O-acyltransferase, WSD1 domain-containing protein [Artemisia annua]